jgi:hypothetical protein
MRENGSKDCNATTAFFSGTIGNKDRNKLLHRKIAYAGTAMLDSAERAP